MFDSSARQPGRWRTLAPLFAAVSLSLGTAHAQDETADDVEGSEEAVEFETFEVTGSRIRRADFETAQPVLVIDRADIERTGLTNIGDLLQEIPSAGSALNRTFNNGGTGATEVDLRNLGSTRVLVLVDGRRWINGTSFANTGAVDLNTIPTAIIERVEILKDGASAVYGSDAITGVINFITRKDFTGTQLTSQVGAFNFEDGTQQQHSVSFGNVTQDTSMFFNMSYTKQDALFAGDRAISSVPLFGTGITRGSIFSERGTVLFVPDSTNTNLLEGSNPDNCIDLAPGVAQGTVSGGVGQAPVATPVGPTPGIIVPGMDPPFNFPDAGATSALALCNIILAQGANLTTPDPSPGSIGSEVGEYKPFDVFEDPYNFAPVNYLLTPFEQTSAFTQINRRIADNLSVGAQILYTNNRTERELAETPLIFGNLLFPPFDTIFVAEDNFFNPFDQNIGASDDGDGFAGLVGLGIVGRRFRELGPRTLTRETETLFVRSNLVGDFDALGRFFNWELGYSWGENTNTNRDTGDLNMENVARALGPPEFCGGDPRIADGTVVAAETVDPDCVPLNIFGPVGSITQEQLDYVSYEAASAAESQVGGFSGIISTEISEFADFLPAPVGIAAGFEVRRESFSDQPDALVAQAISSTNLRRATTGSISSREAFIEMDVPVLEGMPFAESLGLNIAGRFTDYDTFDRDFNGKIGIRWQPIPDLLVRMTGSTAFRAPAITDLFLAPIDSFPLVADPCENAPPDSNAATNCAEEGVPPSADSQAQVLAQFGGNPNLQPETAETLLGGLVWSPSFIEDFDLTIDYFNITLDDFIGFVGPQFILDSCYTRPPGTPRPGTCDLVQRNDNGGIRQIDSRSLNFAFLETSGVDIVLNYTMPVNDWFSRFGWDVPGVFKLQMDSTYLDDYTQSLPNAEGGLDSVSFEGLTVGGLPLPTWKVNSTVSWSMGPFSASWVTRFISRTQEQCNDGRAPSVQSFGLCDINDPDVDLMGTDDLGNPISLSDGVDTSVNFLPSTFYHNVQFAYQPPQLPGAEFLFGVRNVFDKEPPVSFQAFANSFPPTVYEPPGSQEPYLRFKYDF